MNLTSLKLKHNIFFLVFLSSLITTDRLTKNFFITNPDYFRDFWFFSFNYSLNPNIAFSLPLPRVLIFIFTVSILLYLFFLIIKSFKQSTTRPMLFLVLIIIGAVSNFWDRLKFGGVIDFIDVPYFTVFNLSDTYIFIGVCWWLRVEMHGNEKL